MQNCGQQVDTSNCGIHLLSNAIAIAETRPITKSLKCVSLRREFRNLLLPSSIVEAPVDSQAMTDLRTVYSRIKQQLQKIQESQSQEINLSNLALKQHRIIHSLL